MFNLFKKTKQTTEYPMRKVEYPAVVHEIHNSFMNAGEKLLADAKKIISDAEIKDEEKVNRLKKVGFVNANQVKAAEKAIADKTRAEANAKIVEHYATKYPKYKFITDEIVESICKKYNLVMGDIGQYKGFVPEKNLLEIEKFSVKDEDCVVLNNTSSYILRVMAQQMQDYNRFRTRGIDQYIQGLDPYYDGFLETKKEPAIEYKRGFKICAPEKDMDTFGYTKHGHKLIPDPVVLHPVKNGYLIVTAWGDEASDELVVNQQMN